jgi:hypothetical protein
MSLAEDEAMALKRINEDPTTAFLFSFLLLRMARKGWPAKLARKDADTQTRYEISEGRAQECQGRQLGGGMSDPHSQHPLERSQLCVVVLYSGDRDHIFFSHFAPPRCVLEALNVVDDFRCKTQDRQHSAYPMTRKAFIAANLDRIFDFADVDFPLPSPSAVQQLDDAWTTLFRNTQAWSTGFARAIERGRACKFSRDFWTKLDALTPWPASWRTPLNGRRPSLQKVVHSPASPQSRTIGTGVPRSSSRNPELDDPLGQYAGRIYADQHG